MDKEQTLLEACLKWKKIIEWSLTEKEKGVADHGLFEAIDREVERQKEFDPYEVMSKMVALDYMKKLIHGAEEIAKLKSERDTVQLTVAMNDLLAEQKETNRMLGEIAVNTRSLRKPRPGEPWPTRYG